MTNSGGGEQPPAPLIPPTTAAMAEALEPAEPRTRTDEVTELRRRLKALATTCVQSDDLEASQSLLGAALMCGQALEQLEQDGQGEEPYP